MDEIISRNERDGQTVKRLKRKRIKKKQVGILQRILQYFQQIRNLKMKRNTRGSLMRYRVGRQPRDDEKKQANKNVQAQNTKLVNQIERVQKQFEEYKQKDPKTKADASKKVLFQNKLLEDQLKKEAEAKTLLQQQSQKDREDLEKLNKEIASQQVELANAFNALQKIKRENIQGILVEKKQKKDIKMLSEQLPRHGEEYKQIDNKISDKDIIQLKRKEFSSPDSLSEKKSRKSKSPRRQNPILKKKSFVAEQEFSSSEQESASSKQSSSPEKKVFNKTAQQVHQRLQNYLKMNNKNMQTKFYQKFSVQEMQKLQPEQIEQLDKKIDAVWIASNPQRQREKRVELAQEIQQYEPGLKIKDDQNRMYLEYQAQGLYMESSAGLTIEELDVILDTVEEYIGTFLFPSEWNQLAKLIDENVKHQNTIAFNIFNKQGKGYHCIAWVIDFEFYNICQYDCLYVSNVKNKQYRDDMQMIFQYIVECVKQYTDTEFKIKINTQEQQKSLSDCCYFSAYFIQSYLATYNFPASTLYNQQDIDKMKQQFVSV